MGWKRIRVGRCKIECLPKLTDRYFLHDKTLRSFPLRYRCFYFIVQRPCSRFLEYAVTQCTVAWKVIGSAPGEETKIFGLKISGTL